MAKAFVGIMLVVIAKSGNENYCNELVVIKDYESAFDAVTLIQIP